MSCQNIYPFVAIVGQENMKLALCLNLIDPTISGVLIRGEKGTAKSTAVRALADILPKIEVIKDCPFQLSPNDSVEICRGCFMSHCREKRLNNQEVETICRHIRVVELPIGATEDRVVGTLDLEYAIKKGKKRIEPGLLAAAHRGILYIDEVNLLDDHVVDVLLDAAAMGINTIEREGISFSHPASFLLIGTMNPEEGELRPQLLDRFGLSVYVKGIEDPRERVLVMERRIAFDQDPEGFCSMWLEKSQELADKIERAKLIHPHVIVDQEHLYYIAELCTKMGIDGHRGDIVTLKTAKAMAAFEGKEKVETTHIDVAAELALPHRMRRTPFMDVENKLTPPSSLQNTIRGDGVSF